MRVLSFIADGERRLGILSDGRVRDLSEHRTEFPDLVSVLAPAKRGRLEVLLPTLTKHAPESVQLLPPLAPGARIFCVGVNYAKRHPVTGELSAPPPAPTIFCKMVETMVGHNEAIEYPAGLSEQLDYECELAVVIGRPAFRIAEADAMAHVAGYTVLNDGSVRDWQKHSLFSGKNFFRSSSCGPWIVTADEIAEPMRLMLATRRNGEEVQRTSTGAMLFGVAEIVSHISQITPLAAGDIIATGSPDGSGGSREPQRFLRPGDRLEFEIGGIGALWNTVQ